VCATILLAGCATTPDARSLRAEPISFKTIQGAPAVQDGRARFREVFCSTMLSDGLVPGDDLSCRRWLWRLPDEPEASAAPGAAAAAQRPPVVFLVTGAFSECVGEAARPFLAGAARLRASGARVETIVVSGRSGTASNARQIADAIERAQIPAEQTLIVIGYSKGTLDLLRSLVDFPALAGRVDAVVSVASPVFGTALADVAGPAYSSLLAKLPYGRCPPGDGQVLQSLSPATATQWLASNPLPEHVRYYSLAGFTTRKHVARALVPSWKYLNGIDFRNDGQVVAADAVIPGSTLLGYANADHWGIAETIESVHPVLVARPDPAPFPLEQLFLSIVKFVSDDLDGTGLDRHGAAR
jgi:hypothetical protein